ncbi:S-layer family protein [Nostoc sp. ChiVER01]|uniref:S-layer family protein n=1 Tax=Nostoc sp. ChiVER01 TaxID=3075382 RepID=UPI002AD406EF|nr:S-layer family protein [Nostoc sp. ChiVER01]MDZ8224081.1 S-layer family protein [Nostoc sp. ChiVER01]
MSQWYLNLWVMVGSTLWVLGCIQPIAAQVIPDNTLPALERSQVSGNPNFQINGGARRGGNLFHSFQSFSVPTGGSVYFNNAADVQNIFSRVTGGSISKIDGVIRANGTANLFLLNPNGIVFNAGASLDIAGSFVASTASSLKFANGFEFSATNPQSAPLLSINVPTGLQYGVNPGAIQVKGDGQGQLIDNTFGLRVQSNQTLALVGGDVSLEGATLLTGGGRIELGSVAGEGLVNLTFDNKGFFLGYDAVPNFGNIQLSQQATVDASGAEGGNIQVQGKRITLTDGSQIATNTLGVGQGGSLVIHATDVLEIIGISNDGQYRSNLSVQTQGTGNAGEFRIDTQKLLIQDGAFVDASTYGEGKGGNLFVTADSVQLISNSNDGQYLSNLSVQTQGTGNAGELRISTQKLLIQDGSFISAGTNAAGKGGNLFVTADSVQVIGSTKDGQYLSNLSAEAQGTGNAGELHIDTSKLLIQDGAFISAGTYGAGNGGNLFVTADSVRVIGSTKVDQYPSDLSVQTQGTGNAGELHIDTSQLLIQDGAQVSASTFGAGKGGNLFVTADSVQVIGSTKDDLYPSSLSAEAYDTGNAGELHIETRQLLISGAQVSAGTRGGGKGGNLFVTADSVQVIGSSKNGQYPSNLSVQTQDQGNAGELRINTQKLLIQDGAQVTASTFGAGNGGNLFVTADSVQVIGSSRNGLYPSNLTVQANDTGNAGELHIDTPQLLIQDGGLVSAGTTGAGNGGNLFITADSVQVIGSSNDRQHPSNLSVQAKGTGTAGSLFVEANFIGLDNNAEITADTTGGGGNIFLRTPLLLLRDRSSITTNATGANIPGGNITIDAANGFIIAVPQENSDISANSLDFRGGRVAINAQSIFGMQYRSNIQTPQSDITATGASPQFNGSVQINTPDVDPSSGLVQLPADFVDRSGLIAQGCPANKGNSFTITGRGGLPPLPTQALRTNQTATVDWVTLNPQEQKSTNVTENSHLARGLWHKNRKLEVQQISTPIVEATGWVINKSGAVELTTAAPIATRTNAFNSAIASGGTSSIAACPSPAAAIQK